MKATRENFIYNNGMYNYEEEACDFMTKIGPERIIGITTDRSSNECSVTVWYWKDEKSAE